jgi:hypothetical protein
LLAGQILNIKDLALINPIDESLNIGLITSMFDYIFLVKSTCFNIEYLYDCLMLVGLISIIFFSINIVTLFKNRNESVLNNINYSGPARKLGEKIVHGLGVGAAAAGSYAGVKDVINDIKSLIDKSGKEGTKEGNKEGNKEGSESNSNNSNN